MPSAKDMSEIPMVGNRQIILAVVDRVLHVRIFDHEGKMVVDTDQKRLPGQDRPIEVLRKELEGLWPPHVTTEKEKLQVIAAVETLVGHTKDGRPRAELDAALALSPENSPETIQIRLQAARLALSNRDLAEARRHLELIPEDKQNDLRVRVVWGYVEFAELHPNEAIDQWRRGLTLVGGGDQSLTWQLAYNLIQLGRLKEADPLVKRYNQLAKGDKNRLGKFLVGVYELAAGRVNEATKILEKIKEVVPPYLKADTSVVSPSATSRKARMRTP